MGYPHGRLRNSHVGVFELPTVQYLVVVTVVFIGVHGSLPYEVVKHFHDSSPLSTVRSQTTVESEILINTRIGLQFNSTRAKVYAFFDSLTLTGVSGAECNIVGSLCDVLVPLSCYEFY